MDRAQAMAGPEGYKIFRCSSENDVLECASIVKDGGIVVYPTDTVYGIGCDPYNEKAVTKIFEIKSRNEKIPLPILSSSVEYVQDLVSLGKTGKLLAGIFWPGALTIVSPLTDKRISPKVNAGTKSIAVRIPNNVCATLLLKHCKYLVGTSANISGKKPCKSTLDVIFSHLYGFDAIMDGGTIKGGVESTIVELVNSTPKIIREGAIKPEEIYRVLGRKVSHAN